MVELYSKDDDLNLFKIGDGTFGSVYQIDSKIAYKIYRDRVDCGRGLFFPNPVFNLPMKRFLRLKKRCEKLKYTESIQDFISIDGKFGGIVIPYYEGETLDYYTNSSFSVKRDLSYQLIRNHKELIHHFIFPRDYKLNNIMVSNGEIKILDLDDTFTICPLFPSSTYKKESNLSLSKFFIDFFEDQKEKNFSLNTVKRLDRTRFERTTSLSNIEKKLKEKEQPHRFYLFNASCSMGELPNNPSYKLLYLYSKGFTDLEASYVLESLKKRNLRLFDFVRQDELDSYFNNFNTDLCLTKDDKIVYQKGRSL